MVNLLFSDVNGDVGIANKRLWSGLCFLKEFELQHANDHIFCCLNNLIYA